MFSKTNRSGFPAEHTERRIVTAHKYTLLRNGTDGAFGLCIDISAAQRVVYPCISYSETEAGELMERMTRADLSPVHFGDVVRDYITELYYKRLRDNGFLPNGS